MNTKEFTKNKSSHRKFTAGKQNTARHENKAACEYTNIKGEANHIH
jgi:hypothetical protein